MIKKLKRYKNLLYNFSSLSALQVSNYIFPLIVLPYLVRVLGPDKYGLVQFAAAFNTYFILICDYGFSLSAIKLISVERDNISKTSKIFSSILFIKFALLLFSIVLLLIVVISFNRFSEEHLVYLFSFGMVLGSVLSPTWFFQGIEKMKYITFIHVSVRIIATILIFVLITKQSDYLILIIINSATHIAIGFVGLLLATTKFKVKLAFPGIQKINDMLKYGWSLFLSSISINLYTASNIFVLGLFASDSIVGFYSAADKIRIAFQGIQSNISQTVFPYVCKLVKESFEKFISFNRKLLIINSFIGLIISSLIFLIADPVSILILGDKFLQSGKILKIISILPFIISISNVLGIQTMLPLGYEKSFNKVITIAAIVHLLLLFIFVPNYLDIGTAGIVVFTELLVAVLMISFITKKKIPLLKRYDV